MEAYVCHLNASLCPSSFASYKTKPCRHSLSLPSTSLSFKLQEKPKQRVHGLDVGCAKLDSGSVAELGRELEAEMNQEEEEEWMLELGKLRERCKERKGMVELLECLEREAIMGDDEGRDPTDYNRRAQIFDKSSKVFQALKERTAPSHQS
ncbi:uncharacterized protein LOC8276627 [Ricinus communis]|uniref:uncharacterized protein LOC8276627 n=1 Tax=Ricinus communis TaxID=3988 RepID=UPI00201B0D8F|nr:uncharacterized protein LOC8276627 [Ricinus communis]